MHHRSLVIFAVIAACSIAIISIAIISIAVTGTGLTGRYWEEPAKADSKSPQLTIWNWDSPGDLTFLQSEKTRVVHYKGTFYVSGDDVFLRPCTKKLLIPDNVTRIPAFRIETRTAKSPQLQAAGYIARTIAKILTANIADPEERAQEIQIDFDATVSERTFYVDLLKNLRKALPRSTKISVTALASWCLNDRWLPSNLVDSAVVMLFTLGPAKVDILKNLGGQKLTAGDGIPLAIGISASEPATLAALYKSNLLKDAREIYIFNSLPWTISRYQKIRSYLKADYGQ